MIKQTQNERGVTLLEILLALSILSFVGVLIWSVFVQGTEYSNRSMTKNQMQQELNIIMTRLTKIHQTSDLYKLSSDSEKITVEIMDENLNVISTEEFEDSRFKFNAIIDEENINLENPIDPNEKNISVKLTATDKSDEDRKTSVEISLSKLKEKSVENDEK